MGQGFQKIFNQQHIMSNFQQIKEMLMVNAVMVSVFEMGQGFQKIFNQQHIISTFQQVKDIPRDNTTRQCVCSREVVCNAM
jgi:hypothetical protein